MKLQLTYLFENADELRAHLAEAGEPVTETGEVVDTSRAVDSEGFPYDPELHAETRAVNADGTWKVKRGKAEAAAAARAAFKAKGGAEPAPAAAPAAALPVAATTTAMPGMPPAAQTRAPISLDALVQRIVAGMGANKISNESLTALYAEAGENDPNAYSTNETARNKLWDILDAKGL